MVHQEMVQHLAHVLPTAYVKQMGRAQVLTISCLMNYIAIYNDSGFSNRFIKHIT